jgi:leucyl-tRNA synthetase
LSSADPSLTELRRLVAADAYTRLQRLAGGRTLLALGQTCWSPRVLRAALAQGQHPLDFQRQTWEALHGSCDRLGILLDAPEPIRDSEPDYYRWAQWIFLQLYRRGLVHLVEEAVAAEVEERKAAALTPLESLFSARNEGAPGRGGGSGGDAFSSSSRVAVHERAAGERRRVRRFWALDVAPYGERLINDLGKSNWPVEERNAQRYRIGRLRGCTLSLQVSQRFQMEFEELEVFTTRVEMLFGATFILVHPWHPIVDSITEPGYEEDLHFYRKRIQNRLEPRISAARTGGFAINPMNLERVPILVSRLAMEAESGPVILGVPAHSAILYELARRIRLPIREVVRGKGSAYDVHGRLTQAYLGEGVLTNSGPFNQLPQKVAREKVIHFLSRRGICRRTTRYFLDRIPISSPSAWGVPVPILHCEQCGVVPVPEAELPVVAPALDIETHRASGEGAGAAGKPNPASSDPAPCPSCGAQAARDSQHLADSFVDSWMFLRGLLPELSGPIEGMPGKAAAPAAPSPAPETAASAAADAGGESRHEEESHRLIDAMEDLESFPLFEDGGAGWSQAGDEPGAAEAAAPAEPAAGEHESAAATAEGGEAPDSESVRLDWDRGSDYRSSEPPVAPAAPEVAPEEGDLVLAPAAAARSGDGPSDGLLDDEQGIPEDEANGEEERRNASSYLKSFFGRPSSLEPFNNPLLRQWLPVDTGLGLVGEGLLSVIQVRLLTKVFFDTQQLPSYEPYFRFMRVGPVERDDDKGDRADLPGLIMKYGADATRLYLLSGAEISSRIRFSEHGLHCTRRFLGRIWREVHRRLQKGKFVSRRVLVAKHQLIADLTRSVRRLDYSRALTSLHRFLNFLTHPSTTEEEMDRASIQTFILLLWPLAPHLASELWKAAGAEGPLTDRPWPDASAELLQVSEVDVAVEIDNRTRARITIPAGWSRERLESHVLGQESVQRLIQARTIRRVIAVPDRLVNILLDPPAPPPA